MGKVRKGGDAFPGCSNGHGGRTIEECQAYAERNNFEGFGRVLRDGKCCFKSQTAEKLLDDIRNDGGVDFYYYGANNFPTKTWKVRNGADAFPGCSHGRGGKTVQECQAYAERNNFEGFGRVARDGKCCFKAQAVDELLGDLRDVGGVDFYYQKGAQPTPAPPPPPVPTPPQQECSKSKCYNQNNNKMKRDRCNENRCAACPECASDYIDPSKKDKCDKSCFSKRKGSLRSGVCSKKKCAGCSGC